ncbi:ATPase [Tsuneonella sp. HG222]
MTRRDNLVAVGSEPAGEGETTLVETAPMQEELLVEDVWEDEEEAPRIRGGWIVPTLAIVAVLGWTGFFGWVHQREMLAGASPALWSEWIVAWSVPVLLVVALWLLAMRNSRREAARFADVANVLSRESAALEARLSAVNSELSLARDFIASQSRDLESLGRLASERISEHAARLQALIVENGAQVETIGRVSQTARDNMERLRGDLPVISNSARDVANQIGHAGNTAQGQLEEMVSGFNRLNQFGEASERQVASLRSRVDAALAAFEAQATQLEEVAAARFAALGERSEIFRAELDGHEVEALAALRRRADALQGELAARHADVQQQAETEIERLRDRVASVATEGTDAIATLRSGQDEAAGAWNAAIDDLKARMFAAIEDIARVDNHALENARTRLATLAEEADRVDTAMGQRAAAFDDAMRRRSAEAREREAQAAAALEGRLEELDGYVRERQEEHLAHIAGLSERGDAMLARMRDISRGLDELTRQGSETGESLQEAAAGLAANLAEGRTELEASSARVAKLTDETVRLLELIRAGAVHSQEDLPQALTQAANDLDRFETRVRETHGLIGEAAERGAALVGHADAARREGLSAVEQFGALEVRIAEANRAQAEHLARLEESLDGVAAKADGLAQKARASLGDALENMSDRLAQDSAGIVEKAMREHAEAAIADLEETARRASEASREVALQLRDQLSAVNELAGNLEHRVAHARSRAEEQVDNDFARRMALITESLNSSAIDITKAFDNDVADTAWASYLRGDRGIFTRRAVRLLDNPTAREVADIYHDDSDFRDTVNRYIHDFEAMLRSVLSTRDGHALGVTLLSSDPGKLYVALAQAIDRLRD